MSFQYDADNRSATLVLPNGITATYSYDSDSHLTGINYALGASQIGNLSYAYDPAGRMIGKSGSLSSSSFPAPVVSASYDASNELTAWNNAPLTYDANANVTNDGSNLYSWDARNHLVSITGPTPASFTYDAFGRRAQKTVSGVTTSFLYDGLNPVEEITPPAVQLGQPVVANLLTGLGVDEYFSRTDTTGTSTYLTDMLGSTLALTNAGGTVTTQYMYEPFGKTTASGVPSTNSYQFTGRENDGTGAYFYRARYYSPSFQRFMGQDPMGFSAGQPNLYGYVSQSPEAARDPLGLWDGLDNLADIGIGAAIGGATAGVTVWLQTRDFGAALEGAGVGAAAGALAAAGESPQAAAAAAASADAAIRWLTGECPSGLSAATAALAGSTGAVIGGVLGEISGNTILANAVGAAVGEGINAALPHDQTPLPFTPQYNQMYGISQ